MNLCSLIECRVPVGVDPDCRLPSRPHHRLRPLRHVGRVPSLGPSSLQLSPTAGDTTAHSPEN